MEVIRREVVGQRELECRIAIGIGAQVGEEEYRLGKVLAERYGRLSRCSVLCFYIIVVNIIIVEVIVLIVLNVEFVHILRGRIYAVSNTNDFRELDLAIHPIGLHTRSRKTVPRLAMHGLHKHKAKTCIPLKIMEKIAENIVTQTFIAIVMQVLDISKLGTKMVYVHHITYRQARESDLPIVGCILVQSAVVHGSGNCRLVTARATDGPLLLGSGTRVVAEGRKREINLLVLFPDPY